MSENLSSSEPAKEETAQAEPAEPAAQPEPVSPPKKGDKKKLWVAIVAVIVVAALIGSAAYVLLLGGDELKVTMSPDPIPDIPAGAAQALSVETEWNGDVVTSTDGVKYMWSVTPSTLGSFNFESRASVTFTGGNAGGEGTIECEVTYEGVTETVDAAVVVEPPFLDSVSITPSTVTLEPDEEQEFTAAVYNSVGGVITGAVIEWEITAGNAGDCTLDPTTGSVVSFSASVEGEYTLTATATYDGDDVSSDAAIAVTLVVPPRSVDYYWYDFFAHELGPWYAARDFYYGDEWVVHDTYPYMYIWSGQPPGNIWIYTNARMSVTGRNMTDINMNSNPEFLPMWGDTTGGNAEIDWYMNYITEEEGIAKLGSQAWDYYDGWYVYLNGTITLDRQATKTVLGVTDSQFDNFDTWWAANQGIIEGKWQLWMENEAGNDRLAIFNMYEYPLAITFIDVTAEKVGEEVEIFLDTISWGMEALITRWLHEAFMPTEWYMEDMTFQVSIGPEMSDVDINTAVGYAMYAYEATDADEACWAWEALMQDYVESTIEYPVSLFDPYAVYEYENYAPGSDYYNDWMPYDYTPGAWNLSENETLVLEWPAGDDLIYFVHDPEGLDGDIVENTIDYTGAMTCTYAEPMWTDAPENIFIDEEARTISYIGPFDAYTWSKEQTAHEFLASEWERMDLLPYGSPYIEFRAPPSDIDLDLVVEDIRSPLELGESSSFNVTVIDLGTGLPYTGYTGTIAFESSDAAADLPATYTFVPADAGTHEFTVAFNTVDALSHQSYHHVSAYDVSDMTLAGTQSDILVVESPRIDSFTVTHSGDDIIATEPTTVTVTAYNQWDEVFEDYDGTVVFDCDDAGATLPSPTAYDPADLGVNDFEVTFSTDGTFDLGVSDQDDAAAVGSLSLDVLAEPYAASYDLDGVRDPVPMDDPPETMVITILDQYGREFTGYEGTVTVESNRSDVDLPAPETFTLGSSSVSVDLTFNAEGSFMIYCNDTVDEDLKAELDVTVVATVYAEYLVVSGVEDMWENNVSDITVTVYDNTGGVFETYEGTITFDTNALSGETLPDDYTFVPGDDGVRTFPGAVSFDEPGTYNITVWDTATPTVRGSQEDIVIEDLYADSLQILGPSTAEENETFSVTVTCYHQYDEVFEEYDGTVTFSTSDESAFYVLPDDYTFQAGDLGTHVFTDETSLSEVGAQTVTVTDDDDGSLTATLDVEVTLVVVTSMDYRVYDMFREPFGQWWDLRPSSAWDTERRLAETADEYTYLYAVSGTPKSSTTDQGMIYAPYRWNITGTAIPNVDVHSPEFMPVLGTSGPLAGSEASVYVYAQYLNDSWWNDYWIAEWGDHADWDSVIGDGAMAWDDGWFMMTYYKVTMNRLAAEEWMGIESGEDPSAWWDSAQGDAYIADWVAWILDEGNERLDIWNGYEWPYTDMGTIGRMAGDETEVVLELAHLNYGYEALMTRWLNETQISSHQVYFEDIELVADYGEEDANLGFDAVCQWSLHCNKQNETAVGDDAPAAWVWEPLGLDYMPSSKNHPYSDFDPYYTVLTDLTYHSWNCGDPLYDTEVAYEATPWAFSLEDYATLTVEMPTGSNTIAYYAEPVPVDAMKEAWAYNNEDYDAIRYYGEMGLGFMDLSGCTDWDYADSVLVINGPYDFTNPHPDDPSLLYHGAPWLEFDVTPSTMMASSADVVSSAPSVAAEESTTAASVSATTEIVSLVSVMCAVVLMVAMLVVGAGRRRVFD